jgi:hypothetical protein
MDAGHGYQPCRDELARRGLVGPITTRGAPASIQVGRGWLVERSDAWLNAFGKLRWPTERRPACVVVIIGRLSSGAWTQVPLG